MDVSAADDAYCEECVFIKDYLDYLASFPVNLTSRRPWDWTNQASMATSIQLTEVMSVWSDGGAVGQGADNEHQQQDTGDDEKQ